MPPAAALKYITTRQWRYSGFPLAISIDHSIKQQDRLTPGPDQRAR